LGFLHSLPSSNLVSKHLNIEEIDRGTLFEFYTITSNEDPKELKGIEDSELIETAYRLNGQYHIKNIFWILLY
jgi:hypothetical protein